jgi:hypothetical protein
VKEFTTYVRSKQPGIIGLTSEDERVVLQVAADATSMDMQVSCWTATNGFYDPTVLESDRKYDACSDPQEAIVKAAGLPGRVLVIFRRFHFYLEPSYGNYIQLVGLLSDACEMLRSLPRDEAKTFVFLMPRRVLPEELKDLIAVLSFPLPTLEDLKASVQDIAKARKLTMKPSEIELVASAGLGLTYTSAENCFARCLIETGGLEPVFTAQQKKQIVEQDGLLEWVKPEGGLESVGGLEVLKDWLQQRKRAFSPEARAFGLPEPRGVLCCGVPGTGKSLAAKATAIAWGMPLLRMDTGRLFGKYIGESEGAIRQALTLAEAIAPCVLFLDELEKSLAGMSAGGDTDGGTSSRVFSTLLTWMQEKTKPVFIFATANKVEALPAELLRKGRWDDLFFVDLPHVVERRAIWEVHIGKRGRDPETFDLDALSARSDTMSGAEIEAAFVDAMWRAFREEDEVRTKHVLAALEETVPLAKSMPEKIEQIRAWAKGRARLASTAPVTTARSGGRFTDLA